MYTLVGFWLLTLLQVSAHPASTLLGRDDYQPSTVLPVAYRVGTDPEFNSLEKYSSSPITLTSSNPLITLDYGTETVGFPTISVTSLSGPVQLEVKYTEAFEGLNNPNGDGPWYFNPSLSNTYRVETFNVTTASDVKSFFQQGGFRWQSIRLLQTTGSASVTIGRVSINSTVERTPIKQLPGYFECSNNLYNQIWQLGPRSVQAACLPAGSAPSTWEVTGDGALIRGQTPAQSPLGISFANYTLSFTTRIVRGGTGWRVASSMLFGANFILTSEYPTGSTFANTNRTIVPPNTLVFSYGFGILNQTSLPSSPRQYYPIPFSVKEGQDYRVSTQLTATGYNVSIDGRPVALIPYTGLAAFSSFLFGTAGFTSGTWGFGPSQDQAAYIRDVSVTAENGTVIYQNPMTSASVLDEYQVDINPRSVCLDGSKRDRLVWIGDFIQTVRTLAYSTNEQSYSAGTLDFMFDWQLQNGPDVGLTPSFGPMNVGSEYSTAYLPFAYALTDYQMFGLIIYADYLTYTGDLAFIRSYWPAAQRVVSALLKFLDPVSGLMAGGRFYFTGPNNGTAPSALMSIALDRMAHVAQSLGDTAVAANYTAQSNQLKTNIRNLLYNPTLGTYTLSLDAPNNYSIAATSFAIQAGLTNSSQTASSISLLSTLLVNNTGYKDNNAVEVTPATQLSAFLNGFLLESLLIAARNNATSAAIADSKILLDNLWSKMVTQPQYYSGAAWEYVAADGSPGLGPTFTSLSHPWGTAPTHLLPEYILGIRPTSDGYKTWIFEPVIDGLDLTYAKGRVPTPAGSIVAGWKIKRGRSFTLDIQAPTGTSGQIVLPFAVSSYHVNGVEMKANGNRTISVSGGKKMTVMLDYSCKI